MGSDLGSEFVFLVLLGSFACAGGCVAIAEKKGYTGPVQLGCFLFGLFFSLLAVIVMLLIPVKTEGVTAAGLASGELKICPFCKESILSGAIVCKHCRSKLD